MASLLSQLKHTGPTGAIINRFDRAPPEAFSQRKRFRSAGSTPRKIKETSMPNAWQKSLLCEQKATEHRPLQAAASHDNTSAH
ncbi:hypothetical protein EVAR_81043_1 [Eumeta japonica]|uniref:Uncharacterized protein n=1 Tax=Eumeta variegata TaxID=151549 RepID=A0A4C1T6E0_EUMVA|nr:hypothetical protein EVAR_81043_1 [Eumeta japonica]